MNIITKLNTDIGVGMVKQSKKGQKHLTFLKRYAHKRHRGYIKRCLKQGHEIERRYFLTSWDVA